ncbi:hypothetical protein SSX86_017535 [Deinandra increscens subsp. villosa]|uniref:Protein kinase domain-containing protein n=1 Tax=Deinandra increscens subsp. villosa TaxID=3103831 RepID=A0AAP0CVH0_9ASTR
MEGAILLRDPSNNYKENTKFPKVVAADSQSLKEFTFDDLEKATCGFSKPLIISGGDVFLGWVEQNTLAPSEEGVGTAIAVKQITSELLSQDEWRKFEAKIGRFGWMEVWETHDGKQLNGTFGYLKAGDHGGCSPIKNDDVFDFGLVLLETLTGKHPSTFEQVFLGLESLEMEAPKSKLNKRKIRKMMDPRLKKDDYSLEEAFKCLTLASRCTAIEPEYRPSREEISSSLEGI